MKCATEMDSDGMIYIKNFIKTGSGNQNLMRGGKFLRHTEGKVISYA
jgi:hypothetical protein